MSARKNDPKPDQERRSTEAEARKADRLGYYSMLNKASRARDKERTEKELQQALEELKKAGLKVSVVAVAEMVGVHPSLVHHVYPKIAKEISDLRRGTGPTRKEREESRLAQALTDLDDLKQKLKEAELAVKALVSRNATLDARIRTLEERQSGGDRNVHSLTSKSKV